MTQCNSNSRMTSIICWSSLWSSSRSIMYLIIFVQLLSLARAHSLNGIDSTTLYETEFDLTSLLSHVSSIPLMKTKASDTTTLASISVSVLLRHSHNYEEVLIVQKYSTASGVSNHATSALSGHARMAPVGEPKNSHSATYQSTPMKRPSPMRSSVKVASKALSSNIFQPIATGAPPPQFAWQAEHFVQRNGAVAGKALQTNKFYTNILLGSQNSAIFTHPYSVWFRNCTRAVTSLCGMSVSHVERSQTAFGDGSPPRFFINPTGIESLVLSAAELSANTELWTRNLGAFSLDVHLSASTSTGNSAITFPIVQGMGFVTALYTNSTPIISSGVFFDSLVMPVKQPSKQSGLWKYRIKLEDGTTWLLYVQSATSTGVPSFVLQDNAKLLGPNGFSGMVQVAKLPSLELETIYDAAAGTYALSATVTAKASASVGSYEMLWNREGLAHKPLLMFALPHHVESLSAKSRASLTNLTLQTTTKGVARAVLANSITMIENDLPAGAHFSPWTRSGSTEISSSAKETIGRVAKLELSQDILRQTNLTSMYWSGKGFAKFAMAIVAAQQTGHTDLATAALCNLTDAFSIFVENKQRFPLLYETIWRGIISSASYETNDIFQDYGNSFYNDHHFHYGYFVYTASVIAHYDSAWLQTGNNKAYIDSLVRDYADSVSDDPYFPFSRSFDWFHGHSWADGLFEAGDSKNEESTSEDAFSLYAMKMWGAVTGDANMEARGNLQLAILARSLRNYFLMEDDNVNQPASFVKNKAVGIMFENKIDHATYFGAKPEFVHGIHMLPLHALSTYTRSPKFVREEWDAFFSDGRAEAVEDGAWRNLLFANLAMVDPRRSWDYFSRPDFDLTTLDSGASLAWYLFFAARMGGTSGS